MAYITNTDIEERVGSAALVQLADDDGDDLADTGIVDEARAGAEGELNSYLARRYAVPVDLVEHPELADVLRSFALDLAEYRLRLRRPPVSNEVARRRKEAIDWLSKVADGTIDLPSAAGLPANTAKGLRAAATGTKRLLSREQLADH